MYIWIGSELVSIIGSDAKHVDMVQRLNLHKCKIVHACDVHVIYCD